MIIMTINYGVDCVRTLPINGLTDQIIAQIVYKIEMDVNQYIAQAESDCIDNASVRIFRNLIAQKIIIIFILFCRAFPEQSTASLLRLMDMHRTSLIPSKFRPTISICQFNKK
jgi:hypothetical protein